MPVGLQATVQSVGDQYDTMSQKLGAQDGVGTQAATVGTQNDGAKALGLDGLFGDMFVKSSKSVGTQGATGTQASPIGTQASPIGNQASPIGAQNE